MTRLAKWDIAIYFVFVIIIHMIDTTTKNSPIKTPLRKSRALTQEISKSLLFDIQLSRDSFNKVGSKKYTSQQIFKMLGV